MREYDWWLEDWMKFLKKRVTSSSSHRAKGRSEGCEKGRKCKV